MYQKIADIRPKWIKKNGYKYTYNMYSYELK